MRQCSIGHLGVEFLNRCVDRHTTTGEMISQRIEFRARHTRCLRTQVGPVKTRVALVVSWIPRCCWQSKGPMQLLNCEAERVLGLLVHCDVEGLAQHWRQLCRHGYLTARLLQQ